MAVIILKDIVLSYGERDLFNNISVDFQPDQKIGVVGRNGAGKSTLLKVIVSQQKLDEGTVTINKQKRIAFLPQDVVLNSDKSIFDEAFLIFEQYTKLEEEQKTIEKELAAQSADAAQLVDRYQYILDTLAHFDRVDAEKRTTEVLQGLGFTKEKFSHSVNTLSVGWKMRLVLAKLLLQQADFYLFDEPTNHLDIVTKEWFLHFLHHAPFGYLLVTHDRYFLDNACDRIFELSRGNGTMYDGNYSAYLKQYEAEKERLTTAHNLQQKDIARKQATIDRFRASASKAKMAQSMIKKLDKIERIEIEPPEPTISLSFPAIERAGQVVLTAKDLSFKYDEKQIFQHASCEILRNQKIAIIAPNGMGKSTLLSIIASKLPLQTGSVVFGHNVHFALFEQDQTKALAQNKTILEEVSDSCPRVSTQTIRSFLGSFLFIGDDVYKKINMLSGGEKNRAAMVKVLLQNANFLLLDEPTNHLDLYAKSVLLQALQQYPGTLLFVSHDHQFVQELATAILELTPQGLYYYPGTYEEFLADRKNATVESKKQEFPPAQVAKNKFSENKKDTQKQVKTIERQIQKLEQQIEQTAVRLSSEPFGTSSYEKTVKEIQSLQAELNCIMTEWEKLA